MSGLAGLATKLPECALICLISVNAGLESPCDLLNDQPCVCASEDLTLQTTDCVLANCTITEGLLTRNLTSGACGRLPRVEHNYVSVLIAFFVLAAVAVLLRLVARVKARVPMWWDDLIIGFSFLGCLVFTVLGYTIKDKGLGTDIWAVPHDNVTLILKRLFFLFLLYITSRDFVRLSILLFYQRIFGQIPVVRRLIQVTFGVVLACWLSFAFVIIFGCKPMDHFWKGWDGEDEGHCVSNHVLFWSGAAIVTAIDAWIMIFPLPFIVRLKFSLRKKILTAVMFSFGIFVVIVSCYRMSTISNFTLSKNPTYDFVEVGIWSGLELYVGIICACLPHLHSLLKPVYAWVGVMSGKSTQNSSGPSGGVGSSGGSSQRHWRLQDVNSGPRLAHGGRIQATTTVDVKQHRSESQVHLGTVDMGPDVEEIELSTKTRGQAKGAAWA
jgi:hypothetical protein